MSASNHKITLAQKVFIAVLTQTKGPAWNVWREHYNKLSINDLIWINTAIDPLFPNQAHFTLPAIKEAFTEFSLQDPLLRVIELGCHQGHLAKELLDTDINISYWRGYDVNYSAIDRSVVEDSRYDTIKMIQWFHNMSWFPHYNVFVSSHTLEHFNFKQAQATIKAVARAGIKYMMIEIPFKLNGAPEWKDAHGSHVLNSTRSNFEDMIQAEGFSKIYYNTCKKGWAHIYGWENKSNNPDNQGTKS